MFRLFNGLQFGGPDVQAPLSYWLASDEFLASICNHCGPTGWKAKLVPNRIWGLYIGGCCDVHDFMYYAGETEEDRVRADNVLQANMYRRINKGTRFRWLRRLRRHRAKIYYIAVSKLGDNYFKAKEV